MTEAERKERSSLLKEGIYMTTNKYTGKKGYYGNIEKSWGIMTTGVFKNLEDLRAYISDHNITLMIPPKNVTG